MEGYSSHEWLDHRGQGAGRCIPKYVESHLEVYAHLHSLSVVLSVILAGFFSATITNRIKQLIRSMHKASLGNFTVQIPVESADELGRMAASFNHMIAQIKSLFEQIALTEKQKREAELKALHYQINPHLLYNTLNSIQWKARLNGQKR